MNEKYIDMVTLNFIEIYLNEEVFKSVNRYMLIYGARTSLLKEYFVNTLNFKLPEKKKIFDELKSNESEMTMDDEDDDGVLDDFNGHLLARPKQINRIELLPVPTFDVSSVVFDKSSNANISSSIGSPIMNVRLSGTSISGGVNRNDHGLIQNVHDGDSAKQISDGFEKLTSGAQSFLKNFGTMFG